MSILKLSLKNTESDFCGFVRNKSEEPILPTCRLESSVSLESVSGLNMRLNYSNITTCNCVKQFYGVWAELNLTDLHILA